MVSEKDDICTPYDPDDESWVCRCKIFFDPSLEVPALSEKSLLSHDYIYFEGGKKFHG